MIKKLKFLIKGGGTWKCGCVKPESNPFSAASSIPSTRADNPGIIQKVSLAIPTWKSWKHSKDSSFLICNKLLD